MKKYILFLLVLLIVSFSHAKVPDIIKKLDPQVGPGYEFLELKGPVGVATAKVYSRWNLTLRVGGLVSEEIKPAWLLGLYGDVQKLSRGKLDFALDKLPAEVGLFGGAIPDRNEENKLEVKYLLGVSAVLRLPN